MSTASTGNTGKKKFLGIQFLGCNTYGRLYPNKDQTFYEGRCPRCGLSLRVRIAEGGVKDRFFRSPCLMNQNGLGQPRYY
jgi:hypothetical protein